MPEVIHVEDIGQLHDLINTETDLVVKFTAPSWCAPCRQFAPHFKAAAERTGVPFVAVDIDDVPEAAEEFKVRGVPTVLFFHEGQEPVMLRERTAPKLLSELLSI